MPATGPATADQCSSSAIAAVIDEVVPQWFSAIGRNTSPSAVSQLNAVPTPTSHQTIRFSGWRRNPATPSTRNGKGPAMSQ